MKELTKEDLAVGMLVKNSHYGEHGYGIIVPSKNERFKIIYEDGGYGNLVIDDITELWIRVKDEKLSLT